MNDHKQAFISALQASAKAATAGLDSTDRNAPFAKTRAASFKFGEAMEEVNRIATPWDEDAEFVTVGDLATYFGVSGECIRIWERNGIIPPCSRLGKQRFWRAADVPFIAQQVAQYSKRRARRDFGNQPQQPPQQGAQQPQGAQAA